MFDVLRAFRHASRLGALCGLALIVALLVLNGGLYGNFYFDDWPNLSSLAEVNSSGNWLSFVLSGVTGGVGRPLSLFTFVLQAESWPEDPFSFKIANLFVHALNAGLVGVLAWQIFKLLWSDNSRANRLLAVLAMFLWMVHPLHASTVFYVVQRMTLLSAAFTLIAMVAYLHYRLSKSEWDWRTFALVTLAIGFGYLGVLAKENAILLGAFILAIETAFKPLLSSPSRWFRWWLMLTAWAPLLLTVIYLVMSGSVFAGYGGRDFTLFERLLTQAVVLWDYVAKILLPTPNTLNLYNDAFPVYRQWYASAVLISVAAWGGVLFVAFKLRARYPLYAFALLWFIAGHLLESTIVPLEMYFEHRNYVPSIGIIIALVLGASGAIQRLKTRRRALSLGGLMAASCYVLFITAVMFAEAKIWGSPRAFAVAGLSDRPDSLRARQEAAAYFYSAGEYPVSAALLESVNQDFQEYSGTYAQLLLVSCHMPTVKIPGDAYILAFMGKASPDRGVDDAFHELWALKRGGGCDNFSWTRFRTFLDALLGNPRLGSYRENLVLLKAFSYGEEGNFVASASQMEEVPDRLASTEFLLIKARMLAMSEQFDKAFATLNFLQDERLSNMMHKTAYGDVVADLKMKIRRLQPEGNKVD